MDFKYKKELDSVQVTGGVRLLGFSAGPPECVKKSIENSHKYDPLFVVPSLRAKAELLLEHTDGTTTTICEWYIETFGTRFEFGHPAPIGAGSGRLVLRASSDYPEIEGKIMSQTEDEYWAELEKMPRLPLGKKANKIK